MPTLMPCYHLDHLLNKPTVYMGLRAGRAQGDCFGRFILGVRAARQESNPPHSGFRARGPFLFLSQDIFHLTVELPEV